MSAGLRSGAPRGWFSWLPQTTNVDGPNPWSQHFLQVPELRAGRDSVFRVRYVSCGQGAERRPQPRALSSVPKRAPDSLRSLVARASPPTRSTPYGRQVRSCGCPGTREPFTRPRRSPTPRAAAPGGQAPGPGGRPRLPPLRFPSASGACVRENAPVSSSPGSGWVTVSPPPPLGLLQQHRPGHRVISDAAPFYRRAGSGPARVSGLLQTLFFGVIRAPAGYWFGQGQPAMYKNTGC
ncbi:hypothetical protein NDU88_006936 [Pleurodeles waltl]|uniref:Uncharacterized protein n=1 Tax=Pleurodeles waltl TaxID=8319 RepID=A0AAV7N0Q2_PLEWA|nr:hypothetical protein NDU88_006936 [Pleurodeles waltl]